MGNVIKLGAVGALRDYSLKAQGEGIAWSRGPANPFSAKINTSGQYDEVDIWNEWVQENWQAGVGRVKPDEGGFLYGELDTRVPNQAILAQALQIYTPFRRDNASDYKSWSFSPGQLTNATARATYALANNNYLAWQFDGDVTAATITNNITAVWVYGECADATVLRVDIYSTTAGAPNASVANGSATITNDFPGPQWHKIAVTLNGATHTTDYFVVLRPTTGSFTGHGTSNLSPAMVAHSSTNGSAWSSLTTFQPFFVIQAANATVSVSNEAPPNAIYAITHSTHAQGVAFIGVNTDAASQSIAYGRHASYPYLAYTTYVGGTSAPTNISAAVFNGYIYTADGFTEIGRLPLNLSGAGSQVVVEADKLLSFGGYLWRTIGTDLYYSADVSTWVTVGQVCSDPWEIRSMAGLNGDLYCACDDGLYRVAPGDVVEGISPWQPNSLNGRAMCSFDGALYIVVNGRIMRYGADGSLQDVWVSRDDDLPANRLGEVVSVAATDLWVVALVKSTSGRCSVWAYQDEGWHHLATLPTVSAQTMYYERSTYKLWIGTSDGYVFGVYMPANALNPYNDTSSLYMPAGWIQQDKYYGGMYLLNKDWESVTIVGDNLSANVNVKLYWQDEGSTAWESLGTADSDGEEVRWSTHSTRPQGKWVKLGALLTTNDADETPRVRAIITKNSPMVNDRFRDTVTLELKSYRQMPDGNPDAYTAAQQLAHIQSMISSVIPVIYQDPIGVQYEVRVVDHSLTAVTFAHENSANAIKEYQYTLVLEQVTNTSYA